MDAVSSSTAASASSYFQEMIQRREQAQADRIAQGVSSGQLTQSEADRLGKTESRIDQLDQQAMADGTMTPSEFAKIMHAQDRTSKRIFSLQHTDSTAPGSGTQGASALASNAQTSATTASNAQLSAVTASNAQTSATTAWGEMNKLFQNIAQGLLQDRQTRLDQGIQAGTNSGQLTSDEQQKLQNLETQSNSVINQAMTDSTFSSGDFMQAMQAQNMLSRQIFLYRNNQQFTDPALTAATATGGASTSAAAASTSGASVAPAPPDYKPMSVSV